MKLEKTESPKKILLAEDDKLSYSYLRTVLEGDGYIIIHAKNGKEAVELAKNTPELALILMDIKMPDKSGLDATREIRDFDSDIPIIAQTAYALPGNKEDIIKAGCSDYISKPIDRKELTSLIKRYTG